jgi:PAS domain S-box-containing protein
VNLDRDAIAADLRQTGIRVVGRVPWGTHFSVFYESADDFIDIVVPYFKAGLESNEACLCVIGPHVTEQAVVRALREAVPGLDRYCDKHAIEIVRAEDFYTGEGAFDAAKASHSWHERLRRALAAGFCGLRGNGDEAWLNSKDWPAFSEYERALGDSIAGTPSMVLCSYCLETSRPGQILDVAQYHEFVVSKRGGQWDRLETTALKQTKQELSALKDELERRVAERTRQLQETSEQLRKDKIQLERAQEELVEKEAKFRRLFETSHDVIIFLDTAANILDVNPRGAQITGFTQDELRGMNALRDLVLPADHANIREVLKHLQKNEMQKYEVRWKTKDERIVDFDGVSVARLSADGNFLSTFCSLRDVTKRKQAEQAVRDASEQLKALSRRLVEVQESERRQLARELHDRAGQNLTALGINLDIVAARSGNADKEVRRRLEDSVSLVEATADLIVNVLSELRPPMLDDLGLLAALEWYAREFSARSGVDVSVVGEEEMRRAPLDAEIALFRIAQEALNNVAKHAGAHNVDIELISNGEWVLKISDDGVGVDRHPQSGSSGFGMVTMRERALAIGGRFEIVARSGGGTSVVVRVPSP